MAKMQKTSVTVATTGNDGAATGSGSLKFSGKVQSVHIQYPDNVPGSTRVTIEQDSPTKTVLQVVGNTSGWFYPRAMADAESGDPMTYDGTYPVPVPMDVVTQVTVTIENSNAGSFVITIQYEA